MAMKSLRRKLCLTLLPLCLAALPAHAQNASAASAASSAALSYATASVVGGTASALAAGASLTLVAIEKAGEAVVWVLKDVSTGATVSIRASGRVVGAASMAVGAAIAVTASAAGYALYSAGRMIAFVPSEIGRSMVYHAPLKRTAIQ
jgi:hypothetical protein